ncbi:MAG: hypothetical protein WB777_26785, partial [Mycobacterium sp.]
MAKHRRPTKRRQLLRRGATRRIIGLSGATSAFLTYGLSPILTLPPAKADGFDIIIDPIINSLSGVDPAIALDMTSWLANLDAALAAAANFDPSNLDAALGAAGTFD